MIFRFLFRTALTAGVLFALFYFPIHPLADFIQAFHTHIALEWTRFFMQLIELTYTTEGRYITLSNGFTAHIVNSCNFLAPFLLYSAAIFHYPNDGRWKLFWVVASWPLMMAFNALRMTLILYLSEVNASYFTFAHDVIGRLLTVSIVFGMFLTFIFKCSGKPSRMAI